MLLPHGVSVSLIKILCDDGLKLSREPLKLIYRGGGRIRITLAQIQ